MLKGLLDGGRRNSEKRGASIVRLDSRRGDAVTGGAAFPAIAQVEAYWEALRAGRAMPERGEVDPRGLEAALGHAFLAQPVAPGIVRFRLAGRQLCDLMGMEVRGMPLSALIRPDGRDAMARIIASLQVTPGAATLVLDSDRGLGRPPLDARLFLAPLSENGAAASRFLGCLEARGAIGRTPRRFAIAGVSIRPTGPSSQPASRFEQPQLVETAPGVAESASPFPPAPAAARGGRAHLRLVKSGD